MKIIIRFENSKFLFIRKIILHTYYVDRLVAIWHFMIALICFTKSKTWNKIFASIAIKNVRLLKKLKFIALQRFWSSSSSVTSLEKHLKLKDLLSFLWQNLWIWQIISWAKIRLEIFKIEKKREYFMICMQ